MGLTVECGGAIAGCITVLDGRDLRCCSRDDLEAEVEAATGLPGSLQRFFYQNKKILDSSCLASQGLTTECRLFLHVAVKGGMPAPSASGAAAATPTLEEHYADSDAESSCVTDPISECVFKDPVISALSGHTFSRPTLVQNKMKDPIFRELIPPEQIIPNRSKQKEVDTFLDRRLKADINSLERSDLSDSRNASKLVTLVAMVVERSDLTACSNAKRLLVEVLSAQSQPALCRVMQLARTQGHDAQLIRLAKACGAEKLEAKLRDSDGTAASAVPTGSSVKSLYSTTGFPTGPGTSASAGYGNGAATAAGTASGAAAFGGDDSSDSDSDDDSDDDSFSDTSSIASRSSLASDNSNLSAADRKKEKTIIRIPSVPVDATPKDLREVFSNYLPYILGINIIEPGQPKHGAKKDKPSAINKKRSALVVFNNPGSASEACRVCKGATVRGVKLRLQMNQQTSEKKKKKKKKEKKKKEDKKDTADEGGKKRRKKKSDAACAMPIPNSPSKESVDGEGGMKTKDSVSVKVINLDPIVTKETIISLFSKFGTITSCNLLESADGKALAYCWVNFSQPKEANNAIKMMEGLVLHGSKIHCSLRGRSRSETSEQVRVFPIKVANLPRDVTVSDLEELFSEHGEIANIEHKGNYAFVNFYAKKSQLQASSSLHETKYRTGVVTVVVRPERKVAVEAHPTKGITPTASTPAQGFDSFMAPGTKVLAGGKIKSVDPKVFELPPHHQSTAPVHGSGQVYGAPPGAGQPLPGYPPSYYGQPPPVVPILPPLPRPIANMLSANAFQAAIPMPPDVHARVQDAIKVHLDFHKSQNTFSSYTNGGLLVHGSDKSSVEVIANTAYDEYNKIRQVPPPHTPPPPMQQFGYSVAPMSGPMGATAPPPTHPGLPFMSPHQPMRPLMPPSPVKPTPAVTAAAIGASTDEQLSISLPLEPHLMHFIVNRRANIPDKLAEKHPAVELRGFKENSESLEFVGAECPDALEFVKARIHGVQSESVSCMVALVDSAVHACRDNHLATIYVPPGEGKPKPPSAGQPQTTSIIVCGLGRKPIDKVKELLSAPDVKMVSVPCSDLKQLRAHPTCSLNVLRAEYHIAYVLDSKAGTVQLQGFVTEDLNAAAARLTEFVESQRALEAATTEKLRCSDVAMRFLNHALFNLKDANAKAALEQTEETHHVSIGRDEQRSITLTGSPRCIQAAQKEILEGPLLGNFKFRCYSMRNARKIHQKLIKREVLDKVQDEFRVICFMHYEEGKSQAAAVPAARGAAAPAAKAKAALGTLVIELCGMFEEEIKNAFAKLQNIKVYNERLPLSEAEFQLCRTWQKRKELQKIHESADFGLDSKVNVAHCNAMSNALVKECVVLLRQKLDKETPTQCVLDQLSAVQRRFLRVKCEDWIAQVATRLDVEISLGSDDADAGQGDVTICGPADQVQLAEQDITDKLQNCKQHQVVLDSQRVRNLQRHLVACFKEIRTDVEDTLDAVLVVPSFASASGGAGRGRGRGRERGGRGQHRGGSARGRGGHHNAAAAVALDTDHDDGESCTVQCMAGHADDLDTVIQKVKEVDLDLTHVKLDRTERDGDLVIKMIKDKKIQPHMYRCNVFVSKAVIHINAMTHDEAQQAKDDIESSLSANEAVQLQYKPDPPIIARIMTGREISRVNTSARTCGVRVSQMRGADRTCLKISGERANVERFQQDLAELEMQIKLSVQTGMVTVKDLDITSLSDNGSQIEALEREHKVLFTWERLQLKKLSQQQSRNSASANPDSVGSDNDDDGDDDVSAAATAHPHGPRSVTDAMSDLALQSLVSEGDKKTKGLLSTLGSFFSRQSSTGSAAAAASSSAPGVNVWEWKDSGGWKRYTEDVCRELDRARVNASKIFITAGAVQYSVDPTNLVQVNQNTGFPRKVRCVTSGDGGGNVAGGSVPRAGSASAMAAASQSSSASLVFGAAQWKFLDDTGQFSDYTPEKTRLLEREYQASQPSVSFTRGHFVYQVDFAQMTQTNVSTTKARPVRRVAINRGPTASKAKPIVFKTSFHPTRDGILPESVTITAEGQQPDLDTAIAKLKNIIQSSMVDKEIPVPGDFTAALSKRLDRVSRVRLVAVEMVTGAPVHVPSALSSLPKPQNKVVIRGSDKRVQPALEEVSTFLLDAASRGPASSPPPAQCQPPKEWEPQTHDLELKEVNQHSNEFMQICRLVNMSMPTAVIVRIQRIQNRFLWKKYNQTKESIAEKTSRPQEKLLFHGTRAQRPEMIYKNEEGFDMRYSSEGMWGRANYFATDAKYSHGYCHTPVPGAADRQMILAKVIIGDSVEKESDRSLKMPPINPNHASSALGSTLGEIRYDTVNGVTTGCRVYMVYRNSQAYPFYLLTYRM